MSEFVEVVAEVSTRRKMNLPLDNLRAGKSLSVLNLLVWGQVRGGGSRHGYSVLLPECNAQLAGHRTYYGVSLHCGAKFFINLLTAFILVLACM